MTGMRPPTVAEARMFADLVWVGMEPEEAIVYAALEVEPGVYVDLARSWRKSRAVLEAQADLVGGDWRTLTPETRARRGLERARNAMAYFLLTHNVGVLNTDQLSKALKFIEYLEKWLAGTAGQSDPFAAFFEKVRQEASQQAAERVQ